MVVRVWGMPLMAIFDGGGGEGGEGCRSRAWCTTIEVCCQRKIHGAKTIRMTNGPISEGVSGFEGGAGRLMSVGVDMLLEGRQRRCTKVRNMPGLRRGVTCGFQVEPLRHDLARYNRQVEDDAHLILGMADDFRDGGSS